MPPLAPLAARLLLLAAQPALGGRRSRAFLARGASGREGTGSRRAAVELGAAEEPLAPPAGPNLVANGGMEEGRHNWTDLCPDVHYLGHRDVEGAGCSHSGPWAGADLNNSDLANGTVWRMKANCFNSNRGGIYQDITTTPGIDYAVSFASIDGLFLYSSKPDSSGTVHLEVQSPIGTTVLDESHDMRASAKDGDPKLGLWELVGPFEFEAMGPTARIYLYAGGTSCPSVDDVRVVRVGANSSGAHHDPAGEDAAAGAAADGAPHEGDYHPMVAGRTTRKIEEVVQPWQNRGAKWEEEDRRAREERETARRACCEHLKEEERKYRSTTTLPPMSTTMRQQLGCCQKIVFRAGSLAANASGIYEIDPSFEAFGTVYRLQGPGTLDGAPPVIVLDPWSSRWLLTSQLPHCGAIYGVGKAGPRSSCPSENGWEYVWNDGVDRDVSIRCVPAPAPPPTPSNKPPPAPGMEWDPGGMTFYMVQRVGLQGSGVLQPRSPLDLEDALCLTAGGEDRLGGTSLHWQTCQEVFVGDFVVDPETDRVETRPFHLLDPKVQEAQAFALSWTGHLVSKPTGHCVRRMRCSDDRFAYDLGPCDEAEGHIAVWEANKPAANDMERLEAMGTPADAVTYDLCEVCGPYQLLERCVKRGFSDDFHDGRQCGTDGHEAEPGWTRWPSHYLPSWRPDSRGSLGERLTPDLGMADSDLAGLGETDEDGVCGTYVNDGRSLNSIFYLKVIEKLDGPLGGAPAQRTSVGAYTRPGGPVAA